jgi:hypothetical protein
MRNLVRNPWRVAAALMIAGLFAANVYRAATQSISHDEGVIFEWMLSGPWSQVLEGVHGNHHVVSDLASKLSIGVLGLSELSLRIPALAGGLLYFCSVFGISALLAGEGFVFLLSVALLCLNPFVLDYLVCARGYGLALGFLFYALYQLARCLAAPQKTRELNKAGVALGLSIGSNPVMVFPGAALAVAFLALRIAGDSRRPAAPVAESRKERRKAARRAPSAGTAGLGWKQAFTHLALPAAALGGLISMLPKRLIELEPGYFGPPSLAAILAGLVRPSLFHSATGFAGLLTGLRADTVVWVVTNLVAPAGLVVLMAVAIRILARTRDIDALPPIDRFLLLLAGALPLALALIVISRYAFEQPYPEMRTAVYWLPLLSLGALAILRRSARAFAVPLAVVLVACVLQYVSQFNTRYFAEWSYCAAGKDMMQIVRAQHAREPATGVRIGATWQLEPVINFYRVAWRLDWMEPVDRESPDGAFDYYLLAFGDRSLVATRRLKVLADDRLSGTVLAAP